MTKTTLKIDGMMCGMCESHMNDLVRKLFKVKSVSSSAKKGETIIVTDGDIDLSTMEKEIEGIGYKLLSVNQEPYKKKGFLSGLFGK
ncbi:hypothetical protein P261_00282 [Lachnospiraceae bacterium TWA4]|nr:hypothetical protein P261_00282 [Lachnospiraceae bacterium TWA4]